MTLEQVATSASQRCHWKLNESGLPDQLPSAAVRVCPTLAVPEIVGGAVFFGPAVDPAGVICAVSFDCAAVEPSAFVAME